MIIIKIIILYFIQITDTGDLPSTGTQLVAIKHPVQINERKYNLYIYKLL